MTDVSAFYKKKKTKTSIYVSCKARSIVSPLLFLDTSVDSIDGILNENNKLPWLFGLLFFCVLQYDSIIHIIYSISIDFY